MPIVPPPREQWFVVQVLSGQEKRVHDSMMRRIVSEEMSDYIYEVLVPTERVAEVKKGQKRESNRKFFPGYVIVNMHLLDENNEPVGETWYFVQETPGVINFAGSKNRPVPMRKSEIESILSQIKSGEEGTVPKVQFEVGETVKVADGAFESQNGIVEEIDHEKGKIRVAVNIFGRETPVDLETWQVEKV